MYINVLPLLFVTLSLHTVKDLFSRSLNCKLINEKAKQRSEIDTSIWNINSRLSLCRSTCAIFSSLTYLCVSLCAFVCIVAFTLVHISFSSSIQIKNQSKMFAVLPNQNNLNWSWCFLTNKRKTRKFWTLTKKKVIAEWIFISVCLCLCVLAICFAYILPLFCNDIELFKSSGVFCFFCYLNIFFWFPVLMIIFDYLNKDDREEPLFVCFLFLSPFFYINILYTYLN